jgi:exosome complex exonuclease RRP6
MRVSHDPQSQQPRKWKGAGLDRNIRNANIVKPQLVFEHAPDNSLIDPWRPILTRKPHALVSLEESLGSPDDTTLSVYDYSVFLPLLAIAFSNKSANAEANQEKLNQRLKRLKSLGSIIRTNGRFRYKHPYEAEILLMKYPESVYQSLEPIPYQPVDTTTATWVDTYEGVLDMLEELKQEKEIAVDLEHHDYRSYHGLVSLMQVSTRAKDWIVDTLQPWRHQLEILNQVFADPSIVKVGHRR